MYLILVGRISQGETKSSLGEAAGDGVMSWKERVLALWEKAAESRSHFRIGIWKWTDIDFRQILFKMVLTSFRYIESLHLRTSLLLLE
jgi:hypothetical protein